MGVVLAIAGNTFREVIRQRIFVLILILTAILLAVLVIMPYFTLRQETDMFKDLALSTAMLAMVFLVALTASSTVAEELDSRTALTVLAKPVARWQFLLGKYLGVLAALLVATVILGAVLFLTTYLRVYSDASPIDRRPAFSLSQSATALEFRQLMLGHALTMLPGSLMMLLQAAVLAAVAVVLAARFSRVLAVIVTCALFLAGNLTEFLSAAAQQAPDGQRLAADLTTRLLPFLATFNIVGTLSHSVMPLGSPALAAALADTGLAAIYAVLYITCILLVGALLLRHREIT